MTLLQDFEVKFPVIKNEQSDTVLLHDCLFSHITNHFEPPADKWGDYMKFLTPSRIFFLVECGLAPCMDLQVYIQNIQNLTMSPHNR